MTTVTYLAFFIVQYNGPTNGRQITRATQTTRKTVVYQHLLIQRSIVNATHSQTLNTRAVVLIAPELINSKIRQRFSHGKRKRFTSND